MKLSGRALADRHAGDELAQHGADRQTGDSAELPQLLALRFGEPHGYHVVFIARPVCSFLRPEAAKFSARRRHWGLG